MQEILTHASFHLGIRMLPSQAKQTGSYWSYTNPAQNVVTIHASPAYIDEVLKVYNHEGALVYMGKKEAKSTRLNIAHVAAYMYFIRLGEQRQSIAKFMKE